MHVPQDSLIIAVLANTSPAPSDAVAASLARAVLGLPAPTPAGPPKDLPLTADERARYVGEYKLTRPDGSRSSFKVFEENGQLMAQPEGQRAVKLMSQGNNVFIAQGAGRIAFDVTNGRATGFQFGAGARAVEGVRK